MDLTYYIFIAYLDNLVRNGTIRLPAFFQEIRFKNFPVIEDIIAELIVRRNFFAPASESYRAIDLIIGNIMEFGIPQIPPGKDFADRAWHLVDPRPTGGHPNGVTSITKIEVITNDPLIRSNIGGFIGGRP